MLSLPPVLQEPSSLGRRCPIRARPAKSVKKTCWLHGKGTCHCVYGSVQSQSSGGYATNDAGDKIADCAHLKYGSTCCCSSRGSPRRISGTGDSVGHSGKSLPCDLVCTKTPYRMFPVVVSGYSYCCGVVLPHKELAVAGLVTLARRLSESVPSTMSCWRSIAVFPARSDGKTDSIAFGSPPFPRRKPTCHLQKLVVSGESLGFLVFNLVVSSLGSPAHLSVQLR